MKFLKQHHVPWMGPIIDSLYTALPILSIVNFLSILTVLYVSIKENLLPWAPWLEFWQFITIVFVLTLLMMVFIYRFVLSSLWSFRNQQMNSSESVVLKEIRALREDFENAGIVGKED